MLTLVLLVGYKPMNIFRYICIILTKTLKSCNLSVPYCHEHITKNQLGTHRRTPRKLDRKRLDLLLLWILLTILTPSGSLWSNMRSLDPCSTVYHPFGWRTWSSWTDDALSPSHGFWPNSFGFGEGGKQSLTERQTLKITRFSV